MTSCKRFEEKGLLLLEQGKSLDEHYQHCDDCLIAMAKYKNLQLAIAELDADAKPGAGWQDTVLEETQKLAPVDSVWQRPAVLTGLAASMAVAFGIVLLQRNDTTTLSLGVEFEHGSVVYRGDSAKPGDQMILTASGISDEYAEIRVYKDGRQLFMSCNDQPPCERAENSLRAVTTLTAIGSYRAVVITGESPPHGFVGTLDADVLSAREQGAKALVSDSVGVR